MRVRILKVDVSEYIKTFKLSLALALGTAAAVQVHTICTTMCNILHTCSTSTTGTWM